MATHIDRGVRCATSEVLMLAKAKLRAMLLGSPFDLSINTLVESMLVYLTVAKSGSSYHSVQGPSNLQVGFVLGMCLLGLRDWHIQHRLQFEGCRRYKKYC
jgi:hypothetical protein